MSAFRLSLLSLQKKLFAKLIISETNFSGKAIRQIGDFIINLISQNRVIFANGDLASGYREPSLVYDRVCYGSPTDANKTNGPLREEMDPTHQPHRRTKG